MKEIYKKIEEAAEKSLADLQSKLEPLDELQKKVAGLEDELAGLQSGTSGNTEISVEEESEEESD